MTAWPATLPKPLFKGFGRNPGRRASRFEPDEGPAKQRMNTTAALERVTLVYKCTVTEEASIFSFFADPAGGAGGGAWFTFVQPFTGVTVNARFLAGSEPTSVDASSNFNVTVTLEVDAW
jgi:hypothetical protein